MSQPVNYTVNKHHGAQTQQLRNLGTVRTHDESTSERILIPQPSNDPNDPLNWSKAYKNYLSALITVALMISIFITSGPSVALIDVTTDLFDVQVPSPLNPPSLQPADTMQFASATSKAAYLFSAPALSIGMSNLVWVPLAVKYGRRPVYVLTFVVFAAMYIWAAQARSFENLLAARIILAWFAGTAECIVPLTIADMFFLHERAQYMALYSAALFCGASLGSVVAGAMSISRPWNDVYYVALGVVVVVTALIYFTMPESFYDRNTRVYVEEPSAADRKEVDAQELEHGSHGSGSSDHTPAKKPVRQQLALFNGTFTEESFLKIFLRPVVMLALPPVLWATTCTGLGVGIFVVLSTVVPTSFTEIYGFETWQVGQVWWAVIVGGMLGMPVGGNLSDWIADKLSRRNNGIREPEFRLPALLPTMISYPGSLLMFGLAVEHKLHWIVPTVAIGLYAFGLSASGAVTMAYTIDAYRPVAGEVVVTQMGFKSAVAFLMSFYAIPWIEKDGYTGAFAAMAGICFVIFAGWIPMYFWGKRLRHATFDWRIMRSVHWNADRETGE